MGLTERSATLRSLILAGSAFNDSRISDKKDTELSRRLLAALSNDDFDEVQKIEKERETLEASAKTVPASEAVGEPIRRPQESDLYIPEDDDTKIVFSDEDDDAIEDGRVDPMEGLNLQDTLDEPRRNTQPNHHSPRIQKPQAKNQ